MTTAPRPRRRLAIVSRTAAFAAVLVVAISFHGATAAGTPPSDPTPTAPPTPSPTPAAPDQTWLVQPAGPLGGADVRNYFVYDLAPGEGIEDVVAVVNHADTPLTLAVFGTDAFTSTEDGSFGLLDTGAEPTDVGSWVTLAGEQVTVPAHARMEIPFVVQVPTNATPGDHVGGIVTSFVSAVGSDGQQVLFDARVAIRMYLTVDGDLAPQLTVDDLATDFDMSINQLTGTLTVGYVVANDGNIRLGAAETVSVEGPLGIDLKQATASTDEILPGGKVRRKVVLENVPAAVRLLVRVDVAAVDLDGRLTADDLPTTRASTAQWAVPWLWLLVLGVVVYVIRRRRRRWRELKAELERARSADGSTPVSAGATSKRTAADVPKRIEAAIDVGAGDGPGQPEST